MGSQNTPGTLAAQSATSMKDSLTGKYHEMPHIKATLHRGLEMAQESQGILCSVSQLLDQKGNNHSI